MGVKEILGYEESIRRQLEKIGWSQSELADRSGVSRQTCDGAADTKHQ